LLRANTYLGVLTLIAVLTGAVKGPVGIALAVSLSGLLIRIPVLFYIAGRQGAVSTLNLYSALIRYIPSWVVSYVVSTAVLQLAADSGPIYQLAVCVPVGVVAGAIAAFWRSSSRSSALHFAELVTSSSARS
jgi:PST family polysaccharide transporter